MHIAIDISPLKTGNYLKHRVRGTGFYLESLRESLKTYYPKNSYTFFTQGDVLPSDADIVHYPYFEPFFLTLPFRNQHKSLVTVHDLTPFVFPKYFPTGIKGKIKWEIQKRLLKNMSGIITDSQCSKKDIHKFIGIPEKNIHVVYLAADPKFRKIDVTKKEIEAIQQKYHLPESFALYVGDATWNKNLPNLLKATQKVHMPLVMVGKALVDTNVDSNNPWNRDLIETQNLAKANPQILRLGFVSNEDLITLYNLATTLIMPSFYEGFGLPLLEAMASGCPVITSREGSSYEVAGDAAWYVDPYDIDSIAKGLKQVMEEKDLQAQLSKKGLGQVKKFSWEQTAKETMKIYESVFVGK